MLLHNFGLVRAQELHVKVSAFSGDKQVRNPAVIEILLQTASCILQAAHVLPLLQQQLPLHH
jgi:hypothetical protein